MNILKQYFARDGSPFRKQDAQAIGEFIENCPDKTTAGILNEVRQHKDHVIYSYFDWDKDIAAEKHWLSLVRGIVNHLEVTIVQIGDGVPKELDINIRAFQSVSNDLISHKTKFYVSSDEGMNNELYREQIIARAKSELTNWVERYKIYRELDSIISAIEEVYKE